MPTRTFVKGGHVSQSEVTRSTCYFPSCYLGRGTCEDCKIGRVGRRAASEVSTDGIFSLRVSWLRIKERLKNMYRGFLLLFVITSMTLLVVGTGWAQPTNQLPSPPVYQTIGQPDVPTPEGLASRRCSSSP